MSSPQSLRLPPILLAQPPAFRAFCLIIYSSADIRVPVPGAGLGLVGECSESPTRFCSVLRGALGWS